MATTVKPQQLNYNKYSLKKYDIDIVRSIPFHKNIHETIATLARKKFFNKKCLVLDLGCGTGITSAVIKRELPIAEFELVDFSRRMLFGAKQKIGKEKAKFILADYSKINFSKKYDLVVSVIGLHHQDDEGKKEMFKKIFKALKPGGYFLFGDLVTYRNKHQAALNHARHFKYLVDHATDANSLSEWAFHHLYLNQLAPIEDQIKWLRQTGFVIEKKFLKINTALVVCRRP